MKTDKEKAAINYIIDGIMDKRCKNILPNLRKDLEICEVQETVNSEEEAKKILMGLPIQERKLFLFETLEACNHFSNGYLLHHALLPVIVGMRALQDDSDRLLTNRLIKVEDMFFDQNLISAIIMDEIYEDKTLAIFLIIGEEYNNLINVVKNSDNSKLVEYSYIRFEISLDNGEVIITFTYKALEFLFYGITQTLFGTILNSLRLSKYDGNLGQLFKVSFRNYYDSIRGGTLLEAKYTPLS